MPLLPQQRKPGLSMGCPWRAPVSQQLDRQFDWGGGRRRASPRSCVNFCFFLVYFLLIRLRERKEAESWFPSVQNLKFFQLGLKLPAVRAGLLFYWRDSNMPGLVALGRRWSVGSDDLVVPAIFLLLVHLSWLGVAITVVVGGSLKSEERCVTLLWQVCLCYAAILAANCILEATISIMAMRGGILDTEPRRNIRYILYLRLSLVIVEMAWLSYATVWLATNYTSCPLDGVKEAVLGMVACNWIVVFSLLLMGWCVFDSAGRSWVKMKKYQRSMRESASRFQYKRSGNRGRNWRHRKVLRAYQDSWDHRCRLLFCCIRNSDRSKNSFTDIARLLSDFFRDLDVVPSDVVAGLVLLRKFQKIEQEANIAQHKNDTYEYLSGVPITPRTKFLPLGDVQHYRHFEAVVHFMHYALAAYGWPMLIMTSPFTTFCKLCSNLSCCCEQRGNFDGDNICSCNYAALKGMLNECGRVEIIYATYHVDVAQTPFFVAIDFTRHKVVVSIRGTLSMKDVITDLNAESETLPLNPPREDWLGHKGMVEAAVYIRDKMEQENILKDAFTEAEKQCPDENFGLVLVGHSLGAGTASILAILMRQIYPDLQCFAYSPPGGLLSMPAVQYTKAFITSVVLGKDVVPRIGLYQMESLRADLINAIKRSKDPKWKTITCSVLCCGCAPMPTSAVELKADTATMSAYQMEKNAARAASVHPSDSTIALTLHQPLYPPGSIIHVVRHHPSKTEHVLKKRDPVYQAIWANNTDFDEVLISPVMIQDHMPDKVLDALIKVITSLGPAKPQRAINNNKNSSPLVSELIEHCQVISGTSSNSRPSRILFETSFTSNDLANPSAATVVLNCTDKYKSMLLTPAPLATPESFSEVTSICSGDLTVLKRLAGDEDDSLNDWYSKRRKCDYVVNPSSAESSPLLSSLHLLTDRRFAELLGLQDNTSTSVSYKSAEPDSPASPTSATSVNSVGRLDSSIGGESLLEDIERSLGVDLSCSGSLAKLSLKLRDSKDSELHKSDFLYPVLHIAPGESSV